MIGKDVLKLGYGLVCAGFDCSRRVYLGGITDSSLKFSSLDRDKLGRAWCALRFSRLAAELVSAEARIYH